MPEDMWLELMGLMKNRREVGLLEYGKPVTGEDVEDWCKHAKFEFLDGAVYCAAAEKVVQKLRDRITELEDKVEELRGKLNAQ